MTMMTTGTRALLLAAASTLALSAGAGAETIRFWTTEEQPERLAVQEAMAADLPPYDTHVAPTYPRRWEVICGILGSYILLIGLIWLILGVFSLGIWRRSFVSI